ncbi:putative RNA-directed DNA polymerase from transposon X-element [Merluccius polli]|uniref:RNA-directed DNA polymerase from transposon X-element n=1 Tax=Merluccius polli TaxID=89951 RepID=A0AA47MZS1_MERPO|nr:putative RNA-directed DNA polymerase from transposon X-element [Merluccius polli]
MFSGSSNYINEYTEVVTSFISKLTDDIFPSVTVKVFPNQKPWVDKTVEGLILRDMSPYKAASYNLRKAVKTAKRRYWDKVEKQLFDRDSRHNNVVRRALRQVSSRKAAGPDVIMGRVLKSCADQLAPVFITIFNMSLANFTVSSCFKKSTIIHVPKKINPASLNDYHPVALTSVVIKCFEKLIKDYICSSLPETLDPLQRTNHISHVLHSTLSHLATGKGNYARLLFIDYSLAFNTIFFTGLVTKLRDLGLVTASQEHIPSTPAPQCCVLSPLLHSLYTHGCLARQSSNTIVKFTDDTVVVGLTSENNESAYLEEVEVLSSWSKYNNLDLNVTKTKEMVEPVKKARQRLYHLRRLKKFKTSIALQKPFYSTTIESQDKTALHRVIRCTECITRTALPSLPRHLHQALQVQG